jgi:hypothetical protein
MTWQERLDAVLAEVRAEFVRARTEHPPMHSAHEGHSVIREELDTELWAHVCADTGDSPEAHREAVQVAAMGVAYALEVAPLPEAAA